LIRFHIGSRATRGHGGALAEELHGSLGIEVDGVDIARGRLEDRLLPVSTALVEAIARLAEGAARTAAVPFDEGSIELILARHGDAVALSLVSLPRPARVLVRDLRVELDALIEAAGAAGRDLLARLAEQADDPAVALLRRACARLTRASVFPGDPLPASGRPLSLRSRPPAGGTQAPAIGFDLRDDDGRLGSYEGGEGLHALLAPGHVYLHAPDGEELCTVAGAPFLLLRDLADVGLRLLEAVRSGEAGLFTFPLGWEAPPVEVDLAGGAMTVAGRTLRCPPAALARALFAGALDLGGALLARNPRLGHNPWLGSLVEEARERLALCDQLAAPATAATPVEARAPQARAAPEEPPLAPGALRRVRLRVAWRAAVGPTRRLHAAGESLWAIGRREATELALEDGATSPAFHGTVATAGDKAPLFGARGDGTVVCLGPGASVRWIAPLGADVLAPRWIELPGGRAALVADGASLRLLDRLRGEELFVLEPPAANSLAVAAAGDLLAVGADNGLLYGLDARRAQVAWRVPTGGPVEAIHVVRDRLLLHVGDELVCFAAATGAELFRRALPLDPVGEIVATPAGWILSGTSRAGGEVACVGADGELSWRARPNLGSTAPSLLRVRGALFARGESGVCRIERGKVRWNVPCDDGGAPALVRGLLALPGERLAFLDAADGRTVDVTGSLEALPPADHVLAAGDGLVVADREGGVALLRLAGALAVVG